MVFVSVLSPSQYERLDSWSKVIEDQVARNNVMAWDDLATWHG